MTKASKDRLTMFLGANASGDLTVLVFLLGLLLFLLGSAYKVT